MDDGLEEEIITLASKLQDIRILARASSSSSNGMGSKIQSIGARLSAQYPLEGDLRPLLGAIRATAQLINVEDQAQVFADQYDVLCEGLADGESGLSDANGFNSIDEVLDRSGARSACENCASDQHLPLEGVVQSQN